MLGAYFFSLAFTYDYITEMILFIFSFFVNTGRSVIFLPLQSRGGAPLETLPLHFMFTQMDTMGKKKEMRRTGIGLDVKRKISLNYFLNHFIFRHI